MPVINYRDVNKPFTCVFSRSVIYFHFKTNKLVLSYNLYQSPVKKPPSIGTYPCLSFSRAVALNA